MKENTHKSHSSIFIDWKYPSNETVCHLSFIMSYHYSNPEITGKLFYCTRNVVIKSVCCVCVSANFLVLLLNKAVPGNIRRAENFIAFMKKLSSISKLGYGPWRGRTGAFRAKPLWHFCNELWITRAWKQSH